MQPFRGQEPHAPPAYAPVIFPAEPGLAICPLNSPSLFILMNYASFWDRPKLSMSFLTQSHQVFFGRPLCLIPSTSHITQCLTQSSFLCYMYKPSHPIEIKFVSCWNCIHNIHPCVTVKHNRTNHVTIKKNKNMFCNVFIHHRR